MSRPLALADWYPRNADAIATTLRDWIAIPSVAALPKLAKDVEASAAFASRHMHAVGLRRATILDEVAGPAAYAEWTGAGDNAPTVLVLAHHDVVPASPLHEWSSPPFEARLTGDAIVGRGAADGKGAALAAIESMHGLIESSHTPALNLKFLVQGEATIGSPNLAALLDHEADRLSADVVVVPVVGAGHRGATVLAGTRGLVLVDIEIRTADRDAATANYGGAIANPIIVASRLAADLVDATGRVTIPGFYHRVRQLSDRGRKVLSSLDFDESAWRDVPGALLTVGESGYNALERLVARPSADIVGISGGNRSDAAKAIVPGSATIRLALGLVPDQRSEELVSAMRSWVEARLPRGVQSSIIVRESTRPTIGPVGRPSFSALLSATSRVLGTDPVLSRHGGAGPPDALYDTYPDQPILLVPVGDAGSRINAPDEQLTLDHLRTATLTLAELWRELERLGPRA